MRSSGFWMHSSHRFSFDPVLELDLEPGPDEELAPRMPAAAAEEPTGFPKGPAEKEEKANICN